MTAGLKTIISLSFILAIGFLLVILSAALWHNFLPLLVVATYVIAPLPNWISLPALLAHSGAIQMSAMVMSILGGLLIYGTIISFSMFFQEQEEF
ncbi:vacuolar sorting-associated protein [Histoplasma capsulatum]|uniref:Vacuolar sorting-associated protein n=4 Tax=Ajellomyces capsulatus TaxID=5037 RepID=C0NZX7_AJECG|nr:vacuolar sorting-associated protein [Histoplasma capsulatum G186AR]EEH03067.1 vacuolar sorting-associated protein [Histoplasma capsulatum G186AR]EER40366.1 vacuolar sorting protein [Histoplasma capsulatum H143]EGC48415.1 vacuolar sorting-associated protein [Histoplasma capsulatum var. duboisii H88]QSS62634.1 vacuolar sorting-associated protein [Histoplasma capsulatum]